MNLLDLIVHQWLQRPARTILSALSVAIAVAAVLGTAVAQNSVRSADRSLQALVEGPPAVDIISTEGGRIDASRRPNLDGIPGIAGSYSVTSRATLLRAHGQRMKSIVVGLPLQQSAAWETLPLVAGRYCREANEATLAADMANDLGVKLGDSLTLLTRRGPRTMTVVGLVESSALSALSPGASGALPLADIDRYFDLGGSVDRVRVLLDSADGRPRVESALRDRMPTTLQVQNTGQQSQLADTVLRSTELALRFSGALSLAMATFIILNTLRMNFAERRREIAVLRVLGATQRQLVALHLTEGAALGLMGSILGIPLGLLIGRGLGQAMQRLLDSHGDTGEISYRTIGWAMLAGPLVAGIAAIVPALQSRHVSPREAMTGAEPRRAEGLPLWATVGGSLIMVVAVGLMLLVMTTRLPVEMAIPAGLLLLLAFIVIIPAMIGPVARGAAKLLCPWWPLESDLATAQLLERRIRTGLTAGVLVVAVNAGLGMGNSIVNNVDDVHDWHRRWLSNDVSIHDPRVHDTAATSEDRIDFREQILARSGVAGVVELQFMAARAGAMPVDCIVRDFVPGDELPWSIIAGSAENCALRLQAGEAVIGGVLAHKLGLSVGDPLRLELGGRSLSLPVAAIANDYFAGGLIVYLDRGAAAKMIELGPPAVYFVRASANTSAESLLESLRPLANRNQLVIRSFAEARERLDRLIRGIVGALWGLLAVGFVVGCAAVANALTMNVLEQTGELGLLRILGMTRRQVRKVVLCESLLLGILGIVLGTAAGVVTALVIHFCNEPLLGHPVPFKFHFPLLTANTLGCLLVALVAGWSPGAKAARLDLATAIAYE